MNFDTLAKAVERTPDLEYLFPLMNDARLFDVGTKTPGDDGSQELFGFSESEAFFLPFETTAIETRRYVSLLHDLTPDSHVLGARRQFALCMNAPESMSVEFSPSIPTEILNIADIVQGESQWLIAEGVMEASPILSASNREQIAIQANIWLFEGRQPSAVVTEDCRIEPLKSLIDFVVGMVLGDTLRNIAFINRPSREFIVEVAPAKVKSAPSKRILRSQDRPQYTILKPNAIRKIMGLPALNANGTKKTPHERRAHLRTLRSDIFCHKQGQQIKIPSTWIGPSESIVGNKRYRVILE